MNNEEHSLHELAANLYIAYVKTVQGVTWATAEKYRPKNNITGGLWLEMAKMAWRGIVDAMNERNEASK